MSYNFAPYVRPSRCSGGPTPGTRALLAYLLDRFPYGRSMGIYNCRLPSEHSEGRALDFGIPTGPGGAARRDLGDPVVRLLGPHGRRLGLTNIIWARGIWSAASPGGRTYTGAHPHNDHHHIGMTGAAGAALNYATLVAVLGEARPSAPAPAQPAPAPAGRPYPGYGGRFGGYNLTEFRGHFDGNVQWIQQRLNAHSPPARQIKADGWFGPITEERVRQFQTAKRLKVDGVVGPATWRALA